MPILPKERRLLTEPPGPRDSRTVARDFVGEHDVQWLLNEAQAAAFVTWYRTDLVEGGKWFTARWPMPQGLVLLERQFVVAPRWQYAGNGFWRVSARVQFRSTGAAPPPADDTGAVTGPTWITWDYWHFEELAADLTLTGDNGHVITLYNDPDAQVTSDAEFYAGTRSLRKGGGTPIETCPSLPPASNWEMSARVKFPALITSSTGYMWRCMSSPSFFFDFAESGGTQYIRANNDVDFEQVAVSTGVWHLLKWRTTDTDEEAYLDGTLFYSRDRATRGYTDVFSMPWNIGRGGYDYYHGDYWYMDELKFMYSNVEGTYLHDLFDDADATSLSDHTPATGTSWAHLEGVSSAFITGNRLEIDASGGVPCVFYNNTAIPGNDVSFRVEFDASLTATGEFALHYSGESSSAFANRLFQVVFVGNGTANFKVRQEANVNAPLLASNNVVVVERTAGEWTLTVNGSLLDAVVDSADFTGKLGFYALGQNDYMFLTRLTVASI